MIGMDTWIHMDVLKTLKGNKSRRTFPVIHVENKKHQREKNKPGKRPNASAPQLLRDYQKSTLIHELGMRYKLLHSFPPSSHILMCP